MTALASARRLAPIAAAVTLGALVSGCGAIDRLANIGQAPDMSRITNPTQTAGYQPVSMPMPAPVSAARHPNSLWQEGSRAFFKDQRASDVGDLITVVITIADKAQVDNTTTRTRTNTENAGATNIFGYEGQLNKVLPDAVDPTSLLNLNSSSSNVGVGKVDRSEDINLRVAAVVTQRLPNGNLVLFGRQEVRVNFEIREVVIGGVIRPADITTANTISYDQLAEARISYGGRGQLTDVQQPRYGTQVLDILMPF